MENDYLMLNTCSPPATDIKPDTERELTILFLDIRNFTRLMEVQHGPVGYTGG
jgi:class 3 adenylate cyclase